MSSRSTMFITDDNEHWHQECLSNFKYGTKQDCSIVLEIDKKHIVESDGEGLCVVIEEGTSLYDYLNNSKFPDFSKDSGATVLHVGTKSITINVKGQDIPQDQIVDLIEKIQKEIECE